MVSGNIETPGEDPYHSGEYATWYVKGMEQDPEDPGHIQASACCKHYVANSMDGSTVDGVHHWRNEVDSNITQQDLLEGRQCAGRGERTITACLVNTDPTQSEMHWPCRGDR